jgi:alpha-ketoglutarate-dependent taurine dioxygenase
MQIRPLPQGFGAEISGFDVQHGRSPEEIEALRLAYDEHQLLVFRDDGGIAPERQVEIMSWFGPIGANSGEDGRPWTVLHNDDPAGSNQLPFHCDISYMQYPIEGISLYPLALPGVSTSTSYVSNALAWTKLPAAIQDELRGRKARHYYASGHEMNQNWPPFEYWHPACMEHPKTGRELLFVTEHHVDRFDGLSEERGAALLQELFATLYAPERRYEHVWQEGDLVIWDNLAVQHARTRASEPSEGARILQRVAIGEHGFLEQLEEVRRAAAA